MYVSHIHEQQLFLSSFCVPNPPPAPPPPPCTTVFRTLHGLRESGWSTHPPKQTEPMKVNIAAKKQAQVSETFFSKEKIGIKVKLGSSDVLVPSFRSINDSKGALYLRGIPPFLTCLNLCIHALKHHTEGQKMHMYVPTSKNVHMYAHSYSERAASLLPPPRCKRRGKLFLTQMRSLCFENI